MTANPMICQKKKKKKKQQRSSSTKKQMKRREGAVLTCSCRQLRMLVSVGPCNCSSPAKRQICWHRPVCYVAGPGHVHGMHRDLGCTDSYRHSYFRCGDVAAVADTLRCLHFGPGRSPDVVERSEQWGGE